MTTNEKISKKMCCFYASDFHLEMTILPYINKKIEENKKVIVVTQNNLEETIKHLVKNVNINKDIKEKVLNINWKNEDESKYKTLIEDKSEYVALLEIRSHAIWYLKGMIGSAKIKNQICLSKSVDEIFDILKGYLDNYEENKC